VSLFGSKEALEAYGREHYYMKRADEDIFIIKDSKEK
jgi:cell division protein FtsB